MEQPRPRVSRALGGRFGHLLAALIALMVTVPLIVEGEFWNFVLALFASAVLVAGLNASEPGKRSLVLGLILALVDVAIGRLAENFGSRWLMLAQMVLWVATLSFVAVKILENVLQTTRVTVETIQAALCVYLLMGLIWAFLYGLIDMVEPSEFRFPREMHLAWTDARSKRAEFMRLFFLSYSTLSAVGGGSDLLAGWFTRMCACLEAMTGQVYLAVLVARLVGLHVVVASSGLLETKDGGK